MIVNPMIAFTIMHNLLNACGLYVCWFRSLSDRFPIDRKYAPYRGRMFPIMAGGNRSKPERGADAVSDVVTNDSKEVES